MVTIFVLLMIGSSMSLAEVVDENKRVKRIAFGSPLPSLDTYNLRYFVQLRRSWACITDQTYHDTSPRCQEDYHLCGAALIHPEFALTAAHCVMYYEVELMYKFQGDESWVQNWKDFAYYYTIDLLERIEAAITGFFILPKPRHTVYTDWALFVGSHDWYHMKQKRHVVKVFPHRVFPRDLSTDERYAIFEDVKNSYHDIALLQACQPFEIKKGEVELAPMLKTHELLKKQYEQIVSKGKLCLYAGFGVQDNEKEEAKKAGYPFYHENLMLHTWRSAVCNSDCNADNVLKDVEDPYHTCSLCSDGHFGQDGYMGTPESGDSGSPVTCEGKYVATFTRSVFTLARNTSRADSYPIHCIYNSITEERLRYYTRVNRNDYHPLSGTRLRR